MNANPRHRSIVEDSHHPCVLATKQTNEELSDRKSVSVQTLTNVFH